MSEIIPLPHVGSSHQDTWSHLVAASWTGGIASPSVPVPNVCDRPGVHLSRTGSNAAITGFRGNEEAEIYRQEFLGEHWKFDDLRDDPSPSP